MRTDGWAELIVASHLREVGDRLCGAGELMDLDSVVLCHDTSDDPLFVCAGRAAQRLWGRSWDEFTRDNNSYSTARVFVAVMVVPSAKTYAIA